MPLRCSRPGSPPARPPNRLAGRPNPPIAFDEPLRAAKGETMASVEQQSPVGTNGGPAAATIPVENPATGKVVTTVPIRGAEEVAMMAQRARAAQPGWEAI